MTLSIEEIEKDNERMMKAAECNGMATFSKKYISDSQEDSPIREGDIIWSFNN